jgi:hypothetical protein
METPNEHPMRRSEDNPAYRLKKVVRERTDATVNFLGVLIAVCMLEIILTILALASLRNIGVWTQLDPHSYALFTVVAAIVGLVATICYVGFFVKSSPSDGDVH